MAEADYFVYAIVLVVGVYFGVLLFSLRIKRNRPKDKKFPNFRTPHYTLNEKKQFLKSIPVGVGLGILVYLQHVNAMVGGEPLWILPFFQIHPVIIYATLVVAFAVFKFIAAFLNINFFVDRQGYADGIMSSFVIIQIIVFIRYPLIFFPTLQP